MKRFLIIAGVAACVPEAPADPSFQQDVLPLLAANCVRCHGVPTIGGAPTDFRLDSFEDTVIVAGTPNPAGCRPEVIDPAAEVIVCGARSMATLTAQRIRDTFYPMPPRLSLDDYQLETIERWAQTAARGAPRAGNRPPEVVLEAASADGTAAQLRARVDDPDDDLVAGTLRVMTGAQPHVVGALRSGVVELRWDTTGIATGNYSVTALVDDGGGSYELDLGTLAIGGAP